MLHRTLFHTLFHRVLLVALLSLFALPVPFSHAIFIRPEIEKTPVSQLAENLEKLAEKKPQDAGIQLNLARLHAMAFALKTDSADVWKGREEHGAWFGYTPKFVPFETKEAENEEQRAAAKKHLEQALAHYKKALELDPKNLTAQLGYGWCLQHAGSEMQAIEQYRKTIELGWAEEKNRQSAGLGGHFITAEAASYLIPLLDPQANREEIAELTARVKKLKSLPRPVTPIAVPLQDGLQLADLIAPEARVRFDADGSGRQAAWSWITPEAGWLVYDAEGKGNIDSALQMFGSVSFWLFWENGYHALAALDNNGDGELADEELKHLAIWRDANCNGVSEPGEVRPLAKYGIVGLSCRGETSGHAAAVAHSPRGVRFADGEIRATYDVLLRPGR